MLGPQRATRTKAVSYLEVDPTFSSRFDHVLPSLLRFGSAHPHPDVIGDPKIGDALNDMGDNLPFVDLGVGRTAVKVVAGLDHTCARLDDDTMRCWGRMNNWASL